MSSGHQQRAVTQDLDFEASRLGPGQRRGENVEEVQGNSGLLAKAGNVGGGVRDRAEGMVTMSLALASPVSCLALTFSTSLEGRNISLHPQMFQAGRSRICFVNAACNKESHSGRQTAA